MVFMCGGASHLETFDHKPKLKQWAGKKASEIFSNDDLQVLIPRKPWRTARSCRRCLISNNTASGAWVSEIYPRLATVVDEITFLKGVHTDSAIHSVGEIIWHTGHQLAGFPSMGSWVTYGLGSERADLPAYVVMKDGVSTAGDEVFQQGMLPDAIRRRWRAWKRARRRSRILTRAPASAPDQRRHYLDTLNHLNRLHRDRHPTQPDLPAASRLMRWRSACREVPPKCSIYRANEEHARALR